MDGRWMRCQSVKGQRLIHLDGLGAVVRWFALVGESLVAAELRGLREAAVAALAPGGHTEDKSSGGSVHRLKLQTGPRRGDEPERVLDIYLSDNSKRSSRNLSKM